MGHDIKDQTEYSEDQTEELDYSSEAGSIPELPFYEPNDDTYVLLEYLLATTETKGGMKNVLEIGTGSGLITEELRKHNPGNFYVQVDINPKIPKGGGEYVFCDLLSAIRQEKFDFCFFNPPYVPTKFHTKPTTADQRISKSTGYRSAYAGGKEGCEVINRFIDTVKIKEVLLLVIEANNPQKVVTRFSRNYEKVEIVLRRKIMNEVIYLIRASSNSKSLK